MAVRAVPAGGGAGTLYYLLQDHLGSTVEVLDSSFITYAEMKYYPFGASRAATGTPQTDKLYTGQQQEFGDAALGLYNYKARFYSTTLGRFVSVDPLVGGAGDPQSWNAYTYVRNNPLRHTDPSGMCIPDVNCPKGVDAAAAKREAAHTPAGCNLTCLQWKAAARAYDVAAQQAHRELTGALLYLAAQTVWPSALPEAGGGGCFCQREWDPEGWGNPSWENFKRNWGEWGSFAWEHTLGQLFADTEPRWDDPDSLIGKTEEEVEQLIPEGWAKEESTSGGGTRYHPVSGKGPQVRVMPGRPGDDIPVKRGPYVRVSTGRGPNGPPIPLAGNPTLPPEPIPLRGPGHW